MMTFEHARDRRLVRRLLAGDEDAFQTFFDESFPALYRFALRRLGNAEDAGEVAQEALTKAISKLSTWRGEAALRTWLFTFCRHEISRHLTRQQKVPDPVGLPEESPEIRAALEALALDGGQGPEADLRARELASLVRRTLDHLPPRYAQVLTLKYLRDLPVKTIAQRLDLGPQAVESLLTRARQAFREGFCAISSAPEHGPSKWAFSSGTNR